MNREIKLNLSNFKNIIATDNDKLGYLIEKINKTTLSKNKIDLELKNINKDLSLLKAKIEKNNKNE
jgi:hypothetical protein